MAIDDGHIDEREFERRTGDDSPSLIDKVPEPPPSHWGKRVSGSRFESEAYLRFFYGKKHKEVQK